MARDRVADMRAFVQVVDTGSFSAAARAVSASQPKISKAIAGLETELGARLINRTTRNVGPTEAGLAYYHRCKSLLAALDHADDEVRLGHLGLEGWLRINTSNMLGGKMVLPAAEAFRQANPALQVEITLDDTRIDPVQEGADIIVRSGQLADLSLVVRHAGFADTAIVAAPGYLARIDRQVRQLSDLRAFRFVGWSRQGRGPVPASLLDPSAASDDAVLDVPLRMSSAVLIRDAALAGLGVASLPRFLVATDITAGHLVQLLPDLEMPSLEINLLHPFGATPPRKIRAFCEFAIGFWRDAGFLTKEPRRASPTG